MQQQRSLPNSWEEVSVLNVLPPRSKSITDGGLWLSVTGLRHLLVDVVPWVLAAVEFIESLHPYAFLTPCARYSVGHLTEFLELG
jgi:hypothetical protein